MRSTYFSTLISSSPHVDIESPQLCTLGTTSGVLMETKFQTLDTPLVKLFVIVLLLRSFKITFPGTSSLSWSRGKDLSCQSSRARDVQRKILRIHDSQFRNSTTRGMSASHSSTTVNASGVQLDMMLRSLPGSRRSTEEAELGHGSFFSSSSSVELITSFTLEFSTYNSIGIGQGC